MQYPLENLTQYVDNASPRTRIEHVLEMVRDHFIAEEIYLNEVPCPSAIFHMLSHEHVLAKIQLVNKQYHNATLGESAIVRLLLTEILTEHATYYDARVLRFIQQSSATRNK